MAFLSVELWDLVVEVLHFRAAQEDRLRKRVRKLNQRSNEAKTRLTSEEYIMKDIAFVPPNATQSRRTALLFIFDENEAVIRMIIKDRSPTMRHVARTHRVALDWLFEWINLDQ